MRDDTGFTPVPQNLTSTYNAERRQEIIDGLKDRLADEEARVEEKRDKFHNVLLPLCDTTQEANTKARRAYYTQSHQSKDVFTQYQQFQDQLNQLKYQQQQKMNQAMSKYSGVGMRSQRDKAGAEASAEFEQQIAQTRGFMTSTFEQYGLEQAKTDLANKENISSRFAEISAFNDAISTGFSLAGEELELGNIKRQIGFFEGLA